MNVNEKFELISNAKKSLRSDDLAPLKALIATEGGIHMKDSHGLTLLDYAVQATSFDAARLLLDAGASVTRDSYDGKTLIMLAAESTRYNDEKDVIAMMQMLLDAGVDINALDKYGNSALSAAVVQEATSVIRFLIGAGADVNQDLRGWSVLHIAAHRDKKEAARLLIELGANIDAKSIDGKTPLKWACDGFNFDLAKMLIEAGADLTSGDYLSRAVETTYGEFIRIVIAGTPSSFWTEERKNWLAGFVDALLPAALTEGDFPHHDPNERLDAITLFCQILGHDLLRDGWRGRQLVDYFHPNGDLAAGVRQRLAERVRSEISSALDDLAEPKASVLSPPRRGLAL